MRGVVAVDVERGIGLGVALLLRLARWRPARLVPALAHAGEHVVAGAVDDGRRGSRTQSLANASRSVRMMGMPPPTAPSKARSTWLLDGERRRGAGRGAARSILFAVTTPLPLARCARSTSAPAGSSPPITSTIEVDRRVVDDLLRRGGEAARGRTRGRAPCRGRGRGRAAPRAGRRRARRGSAALSESRRSTPPPTVPQPRRPIWTGAPCAWNGGARRRSRTGTGGRSGHRHGRGAYRFLCAAAPPMLRAPWRAERTRAWMGVRMKFGVGEELTPRRRSAGRSSRCASWWSTNLVPREPHNAGASAPEGVDAGRPGALRRLFKRLRPRIAHRGAERARRGASNARVDLVADEPQELPARRARLRGAAPQRRCSTGASCSSACATGR